MKSHTTMVATLASKAAVAALLLGFASTAHAELNFCNSAPATIYTAVGESVGGQWRSRGWWTLAPGACAVVVGGDLANRYYYSYAETAGQTRVWTGNTPMCTISSAFTLPNNGCAGADVKNFNVVDTGDADSFTLNFTCDDCSDPRAVDAIRQYLPLLEEYVNSAVDSSWNSNHWEDIGPVDISWAVTRGPFRLSISGTQLTASVRLFYSVEVSNVFLGRHVLGSCGVGEAARVVDATMVTTFGVTDDGRLTAHSRISDLSFANRCTLTLADIDVTDNIEDAIRPRLNDFVAKLDARIPSVNLRQFGFGQ